MQVAEHDTIQAATNGACDSCLVDSLGAPKHPGAANDVDVLTVPPTPPDAALLTQLHLRCGVNDVTPLKDAVHMVRLILFVEFWRHSESVSQHIHAC